MSIIKIQGAKEKELGIYYEVDTSLEPLGAGGMGQVLRGVKVDLRTGVRIPAAIKFLFADLDSNSIERAQREASIMIRNDNLVEMFGFIQVNEHRPDGSVLSRFHVASELLEGVMLQDLLMGATTTNDGKFVPYAQEMLQRYMTDKTDFALFLTRNVLSGVQALHDNGYIHRDIDPSNIMITSDRKIKIIDFGITKKISDINSPFERHLTMAGQFMGKAAYAAPELAMGDVQHQNFTTDLYAIGIMLFQLVTGHLPFEGPAHEVLEKQVHEKMPLKEIADKRLRKVIAKATAKRQSDRYSSAAEFRVDIDNIINKPESSSGFFKKLSTSAPKAAVAQQTYPMKPVDDYQMEPDYDQPIYDQPQQHDYVEQQPPAQDEVPQPPAQEAVPQPPVQDEEPALPVEEEIKVPAKPKSKMGIVVGAIAAVLVAAAAIFFFTRGGDDGGSKPADEALVTEQEIAEMKNTIIDDANPTSKVDPKTGVEVKSAGLITQEAISELASPNLDVAREAIKKLERVAEKNYKSSSLALYTLSTLYARNVNLDEAVVNNLNQLSWSKDNVKAHQLNEQAVKVNPECYQSLYELGCDYFAGEQRGAVERDIDKALDYFNRGRVLADKAQDQAFVEDFDKRIASLQE